MNRESERKRLVGLLNEATDKHGIYLDKVAQHLLDNGVVVPPCKVGQTVYFIGGIHNRLIYDVKVEEIYVGDSGYAFNVSRGYSYFTLLQREVYFTREEALAKLKGGGK